MKKSKFRSIFIAIFTILLIIILFFGGLIIYYGFIKEKLNIPEKTSEIESKEEETFKDDVEIILKEKLINGVEYNFSLDEKYREYNSVTSLNEDTKLYYITDDNHYKFGGEYLSLNDGVPTVTKGNNIIKSNISNVIKIYIITSDYNHEFAFLTKDGDIYVGQSYMYAVGLGYSLANSELLNNVEKVDSTNKYKDIKLVEVLENENWRSDDVIEYHFLGITENNTQDLIKINYE